MKRAGFTLLEVILAISLTVLLAGLMFGIYFNGEKLRESLTEEMASISAQRQVIRKITDELEGAVMFELPDEVKGMIDNPFITTGLEGDVEEAKWVAVGLTSRGAWAIREATDDPISPESDMVIVGYRLRVEENEEGEKEIVGLERTVQKVLSAEGVEELEEDEKAEDSTVQAELISPYIKYLRFRYWDGEAWQDVWESGDLPAAVEISIGSEPLGEGQDHDDYEGEVFRRVVYLPGGVKTQQQGGVMKMGGGR